VLGSESLHRRCDLALLLVLLKLWFAGSSEAEKSCRMKINYELKRPETNAFIILTFLYYDKSDVYFFIYLFSHSHTFTNSRV
jgi:hypothetical protein